MRSESNWLISLREVMVVETHTMAVSTLPGEFKNTPGDASLVPCSVNGGLNREDTLSDHRRVLTDNFGEENQLPDVGRTGLASPCH